MTKDQVDFKSSSLEEKKKKISNLGIYELRGVARALGVSSPTTKKRDYLIKAIMELLNNEEGIEIVQNATKGRPYKKLESVDTIINLLGDHELNDIEDISKPSTYEDVMIFSQEVPVFDYKSDENIIKKGVLRFIKSNSYFLDHNDDEVVFVSNEFLEEFDLQNGDYLECSAFKINDKNQYAVSKVLTINGELAKDYICEIKPLRQKSLPKRSLNIMDKKYIVGGRNVIVTDKPLFLDIDLSEFLNEINLKNERVEFIGLDLCNEDRMLLSNYKNITEYSTKYGKDNIQLNFDKVIDFVNYCERVIRTGAKINLIIYDVMKILNALDCYFENKGYAKTGDHFSQSIIIIERLISLASAYADLNDSTMFIICNEIDIDDKFIKNQVLKISVKVK